MTRMPLKVLGPDASPAAALQLMVDHEIHQVPIVQSGALVGLVTRADVMRYVPSGSPETERPAFQNEIVAPRQFEANNAHP